LTELSVGAGGLNMNPSTAARARARNLQSRRG
jgi:hypothetical protein